MDSKDHQPIATKSNTTTNSQHSIPTQRQPQVQHEDKPARIQMENDTPTSSSHQLDEHRNIPAAVVHSLEDFYSSDYTTHVTRRDGVKPSRHDQSQHQHVKRVATASLQQGTNQDLRFPVSVPTNTQPLPRKSAASIEIDQNKAIRNTKYAQSNLPPNNARHSLPRNSSGPHAVIQRTKKNIVSRSAVASLKVSDSAITNHLLSELITNSDTNFSQVCQSVRDLITILKQVLISSNNINNALSNIQCENRQLLHQSSETSISGQPKANLCKAFTILFRIHILLSLIGKLSLMFVYPSEEIREVLFYQCSKYLTGTWRDGTTYIGDTKEDQLKFMAGINRIDRKDEYYWKQSPEVIHELVVFMKIEKITADIRANLHSSLATDVAAAFFATTNEFNHYYPSKSMESQTKECKKDAHEYFKKFLESGSDLLTNGTWKEGILQANIGLRQSSVSTITRLLKQLKHLVSDRQFLSITIDLQKRSNSYN